MPVSRWGLGVLFRGIPDSVRWVCAWGSWFSEGLECTPRLDLLPLCLRDQGRWPSLHLLLLTVRLRMSGTISGGRFVRYVGSRARCPSRLGKAQQRARGHSLNTQSWRALFLLYLCCVDAHALSVATAVGSGLVSLTIPAAEGVQLMAHGFHEGRPVFSTGPIPVAQVEADLCEVVPLGRSCNLLLSPSSRPRRQLAVFLGRPASEPPLIPCPITMLADEHLHGPALHHRIALNMGLDGVVAGVVPLLSPLPGLPAEQLLFLPPDLGWDTIVLPVDLRPLGGSICLIRCERSDTCGRVLAAALEHQGRFRALQGILGRCCLGWFSLGSQPLILPNVDALQFAHGPEPAQVQPLFGASLEPPFTLDTLMQVSATPAGPPLEVFSGFSANHAVLFTPNGLVYVEVPVFADANTYRRLVALQASPNVEGGIMRVWQPLPSLPRVQFLEVHCTSPAVPCILDFRPTGWRIVTTCVEPPVTPLRALETAIDDGRDLPSYWPTTCRAGGFGILHKEIAVSAAQPLPGGPPFTLLFFPHIFTHDDVSSEGAVGGYEAWDSSVREVDTLPPLLPGQVGASPSTPPSHECVSPPTGVLQTPHNPVYDIVADAAHIEGRSSSRSDPDVSSACATRLGHLLAGFLLSLGASPRMAIGLYLCHVASTMTTQSEPPSPRVVVESPKPALDAARLAPPPAHQRLQTLWQHGALEADGPLWPVPSSGSQQLRFSFKLWSPEETQVLEFLGSQSAREVRTELLRVAGLAGRPRVYAASLGLTVVHVHLVMASTVSALATVLLDAGLEVWCADIPRHATPSQLLTLVCDLAATDALQVNTEIVPPFRHGDVLPVRLEADLLRVDLTRQILTRPDFSATMWLDPVQSFYMLTHSHGLQGFQVAVGSEVSFHLLHSLLPPQERLGGSFLELPARANFPHRVFVHCGPGRDHVVFRVSEASDPADSGFFFLFAGDFDTYADFARLLGKLQTPAAKWLRALRPYGLTVSTWESMPLTRSVGSSFCYVQLQADIIRAQLHFAQVQAGSPNFLRVPGSFVPGRPSPRISQATQTVVGPGGFPQEAMAWQTPPQPSSCEPS